MEIIEKFKQKKEDRKHAPSVTIAFLGDSITEGCFEVFKDENNEIETYVDSEEVYHNKVKKIFSKLYPTVALNIINGGISGDCAWDAYERIDKDIISHSPDLCVVAFGANDVFTGSGKCIDKSIEYIGKIIDKLKNENIEVIFMTESMMCRKLSCHLCVSELIEMAKEVARLENEHVYEKYIEDVKKLAKEKNVPVCDVYSKWKRMHEGGVDVTRLLSNHINHPDKDMHWLFAYSLVETMFNE